MAPGSRTKIIEAIVRTHFRLAPSVLHAVEILHFATYPAQALNWRVLCEPFPLVRTVFFAWHQPCTEADDGLLAALAQATPEGGLILPKLETIVLDKKAPWPPHERARFTEMLAIRAKHGAPVIYVRDAREPGEMSPADRAYYEDLVRA